MLITSVQVFFGRPRPRPHVGFLDFFQSTTAAFYMAVIFELAGAEYLCQIVKQHPFQKILWADLVIGDDTADPAIIAQSLRCRSDEIWAQVSLAWSMALLVRELQTLPLEVIGNEREVRMGRSSRNLPHGTRHLMMEMSSQPPPEGKQSPRQQNDGTSSSSTLPTVTYVIGLPSNDLACPENLLHLKLWSGFREPGKPLYFLWTQLEEPPQKMKFVWTPLRHMAQGSLLNFWSTSSHATDIRT